MSLGVGVVQKKSRWVFYQIIPILSLACTSTAERQQGEKAPIFFLFFVSSKFWKWIFYVEKIVQVLLKDTREKMFYFFFFFCKLQILGLNIWCWNYYLLFFLMHFIYLYIHAFVWICIYIYIYIYTYLCIYKEKLLIIRQSGRERGHWQQYISIRPWTWRPILF